MNMLSVAHVILCMLVYSPYFISKDTELQKETKALVQSSTVKERKTKIPASVLCFLVQL